MTSLNITSFGNDSQMTRCIESVNSRKKGSIWGSWIVHVHLKFILKALFGDFPRCVHEKRPWFSVPIRSKIVMSSSGAATIDDEIIESVYMRHCTEMLRNGVHLSDSLGGIDYVLDEEVVSIRNVTESPWSYDSTTFINSIKVAFEAHFDDGCDFR